MRFCALVACFLPVAFGLKFLSYSTIFAPSHAMYMHSLHESLIDAGHEVHVISPIINSQLRLQKTRAKIIFVPQSPEALVYEKFAADEVTSNSWLTNGMRSALEPLMQILSAWHGQCNFTLQHPGLLEQLAKEKYDAAFSEPICFCGFGIFEKLGIKNIATTLSISSFGGYFRFTGAPSVPSYVPGVLSPFTDRMTFFERVMNTMQCAMIYLVSPMLRDPYTAMFKSHFGEDFPTTEARKLHFELLERASYHFLNAETLTEFPRVITHKIIDIGGISVSRGHKALDQFPNATFIWKYEKPEHKISKGIENLVENTWMPQKDILNDPRLTLLVTHCGQGSTIESTKAGVPLVVIPVLGDQERNAQTIKRIGTGVILGKTDLVNGDKLTLAIQEVMDNKMYKRKAEAVGKMIRGRRFAPNEAFVRNMEFMAEHGPLRQDSDASSLIFLSLLDHYGTQLNFLQYYCMDVFAFLVTIALLPIGARAFCVRKAWRRCQEARSGPTTIGRPSD